MIPSGVLPAAVTPFDAKGAVDVPALARLLAHFEAEGCSGVVVAGTNGEGPSLSPFEKRDLVRSAVELTKLPVVLGVATPSSEEAIWLLKQAGNAGAAAGLLMPPGYFREATSEAIQAWFQAVLDRSSIPVLLYNFPQRTGITLSADLIAGLADHPQCAGLKDSSGNPDNLPSYRAACPNGQLLVGDETLLIPALREGWNGTISGAANSIARWLAAIVRDFGANPESAEVKAEYIAATLAELRKTPAPMVHKAVLVDRGVLPSEAVRLPLLPLPLEAVASTLASVRRLVG